MFGVAWAYTKPQSYCLSKRYLFTHQKEIKKDEVYFVLVGTIIVPEIEQFMKQMEGTLKREINYTVMTEEEFSFRKRNNDPFMWRFLKSPKIMIFGSEEELMK